VAYSWATYDLKEKDRLARAKYQFAKVITAIGHIAKEYRQARIGGMSYNESMVTAIDHDTDLYYIVTTFWQMSNELRINNMIRRDLAIATKRYSSSLEDYERIKNYLFFSSK